MGFFGPIVVWRRAGNLRPNWKTSRSSALGIRNSMGAPFRTAWAEARVSFGSASAILSTGLIATAAVDRASRATRASAGSKPAASTRTVAWRRAAVTRSLSSIALRRPTRRLGNAARPAASVLPSEIFPLGHASANSTAAPGTAAPVTLFRTVTERSAGRTSRWSVNNRSGMSFLISTSNDFERHPAAETSARYRPVGTSMTLKVPSQWVVKSKRPLMAEMTSTGRRAMRAPGTGRGDPSARTTPLKAAWVMGVSVRAMGSRFPAGSSTAFSKRSQPNSSMRIV